MATNVLGRYGENAVARRLAAEGWEILDRNWRCARGELDIVARDGGDGVFVEVKTRRGRTFGSPVEAVDDRKLARLRQLAAAWLEVHPEWGFSQIRIDVIGVTIPPGGAPEFEHLRAVG